MSEKIEELRDLFERVVDLTQRMRSIDYDSALLFKGALGESMVRIDFLAQEEKQHEETVIEMFDEYARISRYFFGDVVGDALDRYPRDAKLALKDTKDSHSLVRCPVCKEGYNTVCKLVETHHP